MSKNALNNKYYTTTQACKLLNKKIGYARFIRKKCVKGEISGAVKPGTNWLVPENWVKEKLSND